MKLIEKIIGEFYRTKTWWISKTVWFNVIALIALILQSQYGYIITVEEQAAVLVVANLVLRGVTGEGLTTE